MGDHARNGLVHLGAADKRPSGALIQHRFQRRPVQIDTLAQRLSETTIEPATSVKKAGDNFARLLAVQIGDVQRADT